MLPGHLFSWLPVGSPAYRADLMSACFATLAAAALHLAIREPGARRLAALMGSLGLAFGLAFWSKALDNPRRATVCGVTPVAGR